MDNSWRAKWNRLIDQSRHHVDPEQLPFPTPAQLDLLKAALLPAEQAAPAWRRWKGRGLELHTVTDDASMRVFSRLWANREAAGIGAEDLPILKGVYRKTVACNALTLAGGLQSAQILDDARIPALFIKGAALIAMTEGRLGLRRIDDVDVLISEADAERAIAALVKAGYADAKPDSRPVGFSHARAYRAPDAASIDLHWWAFKTAGDDSAMFDTAGKATLLGRPVLVASATDCLMSAVGNAFQVWNSPRLRWITDAMLLLESAEIDWPLLVERARRPGVTLALTEGLGYLAREFGASVPAWVLDALQQLPVSWRERIAFWAAVHQPPLGARAIQHVEHHRARRLHATNGLPRDFLWHMARVSGVERRRDVLRRAPRTALRSAALLALRYVPDRPVRRWRLRPRVDRAS